MLQNQETQNNPLKNKAGDLEDAQADTGSAIREGQGNSSILHDKDDEDNELYRDVKSKDISSTSQEEFVEDRNTKKKTDDE